MDEPQRIVEGTLEHRQATVALLLDQLEQLFKARVLLDSHDVRARHHDVIGGQVAQLDDVGQQDLLMRPEGYTGLALILAFLDLLDQFGDRLAQGGIAVARTQKVLQPTAQDRGFVVAVAHAPSP